MQIRKTAQFVAWFTSLRDIRAQARIQVRIDRLERGNFGDVKYFDGIGELRIDYGPGYRVYFVRREAMLIILLCGGDKSSQKADIKKSVAMAEELDD